MTDGHRITISPLAAHVEVRLDGETVASSDRAVALDETGCPMRYYLPPEDVRTDLLRRTERATTCPFKGEASYWTAVIGDQVYDDIVWSYERPIPAATDIAGLLCFWNERVDLAVDGKTLLRPAGRP
jgi:uncharacterized protein (DUF427 family)